MTPFDWHIGLVIAIGIPLVVFLAVALWPQRIPKHKPSQKIREQVQQETEE
ncbi:hypothetical protein ACFYTQ_13065 [Nocardia sp. NPDC004068]|uniref:hypothetical protein n=1 Tax=Nocardia sp. NPDC004068 TaxID=3364303 RepID=UPI0036C399F9